MGAVNFSQTLILLTLSMVGLSPITTYADLANCQREAQKAIENCNSRFDAADKSASQASQDMAISDGGRGAASTIMDAANQNSAIWSSIRPACRKERERCASACNNVNPGQAVATNVRLDCFSKIEEKISAAENIANNDRSVANQTAAAGNTAGDEGAPELQGATQPCSEGEACGARNPAYQEVSGAAGNIDEIRRMQRLYDMKLDPAGSYVDFYDNGILVKTFSLSGSGK